jgi:hypothetical protein
MLRLLLKAVTFIALSLFLVTTAVWAWGGFQRETRFTIRRSDSSTVIIDLPVGRFPLVLVHLAGPAILAVMFRAGSSAAKGKAGDQCILKLDGSMKCDDCGTTMVVEETKGDYYRMRCPHCGRVTEGMVARADLVWSLQPHCTVTVRWKAARATFKELGAVRQLFPELTNEPIQQLRSRIGNAPEWIVGDFLQIVAERLAREAAALQIDLALTPVRASSASKSTGAATA